jgi:hypothetical protein
MPTFIIFKSGKAVETIRGANPRALSEAVKKLSQEAAAGGSGSSSSGGFGEGSWIGASLPRGYQDVTDSVDIKGLDLLNADSSFGDVRTLFTAGIPRTLSKDNSSSKEGEGRKDWVESDTDEQLMLFLPFQSTLKIHSLHITSLPPSEGDDVPMRPRTIKIYSNRSTILGFDEADDIPATQEIELQEQDWDAKTGTAKLELRFVKFQNVSTLVIFVVDGEGSGDKVRVDRIKIIGETGERRDGKIEKINHDE